MTQPTNTDLAAALREIANTVPLGSALVLRLAADRLGEGWIKWDATALGAKAGPDLDSETIVEIVTRRETLYDFRSYQRPVRWWSWGEEGSDSITHYRVVR